MFSLPNTNNGTGVAIYKASRRILQAPLSFRTTTDGVVQFTPKLSCLEQNRDQMHDGEVARAVTITMNGIASVVQTEQMFFWYHLPEHALAAAVADDF